MTHEPQVSLVYRGPARTRLNEAGELIYPGGVFTTTAKRAEQLLERSDIHLAASDEEAAQPEQGPGDLSHLTRVELNELAHQAGITDPEAYRLKDELIGALTHTDPSADASEGSSTDDEEAPDERTEH